MARELDVGSADAVGHQSKLHTGLGRAAEEDVGNRPTKIKRVGDKTKTANDTLHQVLHMCPKIPIINNNHNNRVYDSKHFHRLAIFICGHNFNLLLLTLPRKHQSDSSLQLCFLRVSKV